MVLYGQYSISFLDDYYTLLYIIIHYYTLLLNIVNKYINILSTVRLGFRQLAGGRIDTIDAEGQGGLQPQSCQIPWEMENREH